MTPRSFPTFYPFNNAQIELMVSQFLTTLLLNASPELVRCAWQGELDNWSGAVARAESFQQWELARFGVASTDRAGEPLPNWSKAALGIPLHVDARMQPKRRPTLAELLKRNADDCDDDPRDCPCDWHVFRRETEGSAEELPPNKRPFTEDEIKRATIEYMSTLDPPLIPIDGTPLGERFRLQRSAASLQPPDNRFPSMEDYQQLVEGSGREPRPVRAVELDPARVEHVRAELHRLALSLPLPTLSMEVKTSAYAGAVFVKWTSASGEFTEHFWIDPNGWDLDQVLRMFVARCAMTCGVFDDEQAQRFCDSPLAEQISFTTRDRVMRRYHDLVQLEDAAERELSTPPPAAPVARRRALDSIVARCSTSAGLFELLALQWWARDRRGIEIRLREIVDPDLLDHLEGKAAWVVEFKLDSGAVISNGHPHRWWNAFVELASRVERLEAARGVLMSDAPSNPPLDPFAGQAISTQRGRSEASGVSELGARKRPAGGLEGEPTPESPTPTERSRGQGSSAPGEAAGQGSAGAPPGGVS